MTHTTPNAEHIRRTTSIAAFMINGLGALVSFLYFTAIDPLPTGQETLQSVDMLNAIVFVLFLAATFIAGTAVSNKNEKQIAVWYERVESGVPAAEVPVNVRRLVLDNTTFTTVLTAAMWVLAGALFAWISGSWRVLVGITGVGGLLSTAVSYLVLDLLWRPIIPIFFPEGNLSSVRAFRLSVLGRLLTVFLLTGILPPVVLVNLSWQRAQLLTTAPNPQTILSNLFILQIFILAASIAASFGLAIFVTHSITGPLDALQKAMGRVEQNDFDVRVPVTTNDELGYLGERFNQMTAGLRQGEMLRNLLNLYVSPEVAREALEHGARLGGTLIECTVLFSDIRGFTTISERLSPRTLMGLLNRYMSTMVEVIVEHGGVVNKFGGDSLLAVFGTPLNPAEDHAARAVRTAEAMHRALAAFNQTQAAHQAPALEIGVGIATGSVIAGNIGGQERIEYTVIGDTVNLASRLQDKTKELSSNTLLDERTFKHASQHITLTARRLPDVLVKGKREAVTVYALEAQQLFP